MKFQEAKDRLNELAEGRYHSIQYELTDYATGKTESSVRLYVDPGISVTRSTFAEALEILQNILNGSPATWKPREEIPEVEG